MRIIIEWPPESYLPTQVRITGRARPRYQTKRVPLTPEQIETALAMFHAGKTRKALAAYLGRSESAVKNLLTKHKVRRRRPPRVVGWPRSIPSPEQRKPTPPKPSDADPFLAALRAAHA